MKKQMGPGQALYKRKAECKYLYFYSTFLSLRKRRQRIEFLMYFHVNTYLPFVYLVKVSECLQQMFHFFYIHLEVNVQCLFT